MALTFDGAYVDKPLAQILDALQSRGYRATFFLTGTFAQRYPDSVSRIAQADMELGNHSWSHPDFTKLSNAQILNELDRVNKLVEQTSGVRPVLFRPPYGARNERVRSVVAKSGYQTVYWALDSWDAVKKDPTPEFIHDRVMSRVKPGDIVLMHIGSEATAKALPDILESLERKGLRVVTVSDLMGRS